MAVVAGVAGEAIAETGGGVACASVGARCHVIVRALRRGVELVDVK